MFETADIKEYSVNQDGTYIKLLIPKSNLVEFLITKSTRKCGLWLEDGRHITADQRKKIFATVKDISD